jgi:hypothetical protein
MEQREINIMSQAELGNLFAAIRKKKDIERVNAAHKNRNPGFPWILLFLIGFLF